MELAIYFLGSIFYSNIFMYICRRTTMTKNLIKIGYLNILDVTDDKRFDGILI